MSDVKFNELEELLNSVKALRDPQTGCPWDIQQTQESLVPYVIEEAYEVSEAILEKDQKKICDELGDYLYQVLIQCEIAQEQRYFTFENVVANLNSKLIRRHPHVFCGEKVSGVEDVKRRWQEIKAQEKSSSNSSEVKEVFKKARSVSPLKAAHVIGEVTHKLKFDWGNWKDVLNKVHEEWNELHEELNSNELNIKAAEHELGDLLFTLAQLARHLKIDSEMALQKTNQRFKMRFETMVELSGLPLEKFNDLPLDQKENWYQLAKASTTKSE